MSDLNGGAVIRVEHLSLALRSGDPVVEDVSFDVGAGEILGLVGESGSGKTTTALALLGYTRPGVEVRGGSIEVGGEPITGRNARGAAKRARQGRVLRAAGSRRRPQPVASRGRRDHGRAARAPLAVGLGRLACARRWSGSSWAPTPSSATAIPTSCRAASSSG